MRAIIFILMLLFTDKLHAGDRLMHVVPSDFRSQSIMRCLDYYVAHFSPHATNHFYVGAVELDRGQLVRALVYWKEERTLLDYSELAADAPKGAEVEAWHHGLKLDRDTVDTEADIAGSTYLVTHRVWVDWMEQCISSGRPYCILLSDARGLFPYDGGHTMTPPNNSPEPNPIGAFVQSRMPVACLVIGSGWLSFCR
jgi:hypothetical protein